MRTAVAIILCFQSIFIGGHQDDVRKVRELAKDVDLQSKALHAAALRGHDDAVRVLIARGADVNSKNNRGWNPLHEAADKGYLETVRILIVKGADLNATTSDGETAEQIAKKRGYSDIVQLLLYNNIRPSKQACEKYMQLSEDYILKIGTEGAPAFEGEFPWMAALGYFNKANGSYGVVFKCGGTLISDYFVLTAAHCVRRSDRPDVVRLGKVSLHDDDDNESENLKIAEITSHPKYSETSKKNDIALIKLLKYVYFTSSTVPACLQTDVRDESADVKLIATGWGNTDATDQSSTSNVLRKTQLMTMPLAECNAILLKYGKSLNDAALKNGLSQGQYCTFHPNGFDTCSGDSGGPVQIYNNSRHSTVVGVISFGYQCGGKWPSVNTRVAYYLDWIESVVWPTGFILKTTL